MIYINGFLKDGEAEYLVKLGYEPIHDKICHGRLLTKLQFYRNNSYDGELFVGQPLDDMKSPQSGQLPKTDPVVKCVGRRAMQFLGSLDHDDFETPWLAKYNPTQKVQPHWDPPVEPMIDETGRAYNWLTSFFVYLEYSGSGGETYFPRVKALPSATFEEDERFTSTGGETGIAVKPIPRNAIFWVNMFVNGTRDDRTVHAGVTLEGGSKIGMNIWAKQYTWPV
jgi:prolyl 4-hydroxylase